MSSYKLCRNVSLVPLLIFSDSYGPVEINDDFDHVRWHIEENEDAENELHRKFKEEFRCEHVSCRQRYRRRMSLRWRYNYHFRMDEHDRVGNRIMDKIHHYMAHAKFYDEQEELSVCPSEIDTKRGYIGKKRRQSLVAISGIKDRGQSNGC
eukprot:532799_1